MNKKDKTPRGGKGRSSQAPSSTTNKPAARRAKVASTFPKNAYVAKPSTKPKPNDLLKKAPEILEGVEHRTLTGLKRAAEAIRGGDSGWLVAPRNPGFGTTLRGQAANCAHYLPANRFDWFDVTPPSTGPFSVMAETAQNDFRNEFCSTLATVVGTQLDRVGGTIGRAIAWDAIPEESSPSSTPGIEFSVRTLRPGSVPVLRTLPLSRGVETVPLKVILNGAETGHEIDPEARPSLFFDFAVPQRAVGLEYGFLGDAMRKIAAEHILLIARDASGAEIITVNATSYLTLAETSSGGVSANTVFNLIGVRDSQGRISSVELRFRDPGGPLAEPQVVHRVWHEPLPVGAVRQGTVTIERLSQDGAVTTIRPSELLPFRCDRWLIVVRGFSHEFLNEVHRTHGLSFGVTGTTRDSGGRRFVDVDGSASVHPNDTPDSPPFRARVHYSLLAWHSDLGEVHAGGGFFSGSFPSPFVNGNRARGTLTAPDPCPAALRPPGSAAGAVCGPVEGAIQSLAVSTQDTRLDRVDFAHFGVTRDGSGSVSFPFDCAVSGSNLGSNRVTMGAAMISGRSVVPRPVGPFRLAFLPRGPRAPGQFASSPSFPLGAEIAAVGLQNVLLEPEDRFRLIDVEAFGRSYDGATVVCDLGWGSSKGNPGGDAPFDVAIGPQVFGLVRPGRAVSFGLAQQDIRFENATQGVLMMEPSQHGMVRNDGSIPLFITDSRQGGGDMNEFNFWLDYRGQSFPASDLPNRVPLQLAPGETLVVGGRYLPQAPHHNGSAPSTAFLELDTNLEATPVVHLEATGTTMDSQAAGEVLPPVLQFGQVPFGSSVVRNIVLVSTGQTALLAGPFEIANTGSGSAFGFGQPAASGVQTYTSMKQIEPGGAIIIWVRFTPAPMVPMVNPAPTFLEIQTNEGAKSVQLVGSGVV